MEKIKILFVNGGTMDYGGISTFLCNYLSFFNYDQFDVSVAVHGTEKGPRSKEIELLGCKVTILPVKYKNFVEWKKSINNLFDNGNYDIIHANADTGNALILKYAKRKGIPIRISHSHNTQILCRNKFRLFINYIQKKMIPLYSTHLYACSKMAGIWMYKHNNFEIIYNAIEYDKYLYNMDLRTKIRKKIAVKESTLIVGFVGRFDYQKNPQFVLKLADKMKSEDIIFLMIGDGHLRNDIEKEMHEKNLDNIMLMGQLSDVNRYYNAMDLFILPSAFEGLGIVAIEAQANGLKCIISENIPGEISISDNVKRIPLYELDKWVSEINLCKPRCVSTFSGLLNNNYDIRYQSEQLQRKYLSYYLKYKKKIENQNL